VLLRRIPLGVLYSYNYFTLGLCGTTLCTYVYHDTLAYVSITIYFRYQYLTLIDYNMDKIVIMDLSVYYLYHLMQLPNVTNF